MKLCLGIPTANDPTPVFLKSLSSLHIPPTVASFERIIVHGNFVPGQRELIVREASKRQAEILIMMDDDMILPPDTLLKLLETLADSPDCALVGALYYSRDGSQPMAVTKWRSGAVASAVVPAFTSIAPVLVDGVGFGCIALRMSALADLHMPLFNTQVIIEAEQQRVRICNEDYLLCERLRQAGWTIKLDARVRCGHYDRKSSKVFPEHWEDDRATNIERMLVQTSQGEIRLEPYDGSVQCITEEHQIGSLDYLIR